MSNKRCPHCNKNLVIEDCVFSNLQSYRSPLKTKTNCCGKIVVVIYKFDYEVLESNATEDDWGNSINEN